MHCHVVSMVFWGIPGCYKDVLNGLTHVAMLLLGFCQLFTGHLYGVLSFIALLCSYQGIVKVF